MRLSFVRLVVYSSDKDVNTGRIHIWEKAERPHWMDFREIFYWWLLWKYVEKFQV